MRAERIVIVGGAAAALVPRVVPGGGFRAGKRSAMGVRQLKALGYSRVFNLGSYGRAEKLVQELIVL